MKYQKIRGKARVERPDFSPGRPLDFRREKEHLKDKRTLDYHGRIRRKLGLRERGLVFGTNTSNW